MTVRYQIDDKNVRILEGDLGLLLRAIDLKHFDLARKGIEILLHEVQGWRTEAARIEASKAEAEKAEVN